MQEARLMEKKRKGKKSTTLAEEKKASGLDSRGGTPSEKVLNRLAGTPSAEKGFVSLFNFELTSVLVGWVICFPCRKIANMV